MDATSLIRLVGHEGMGHAMNSLLSRDETLPPHLRRYSAMTQATQESVAQYMEEHIFDLLKDNTALQRQLGLEDETQRIIKKYEDERLLAEYSRKYFQFSLLVLADRSLSIDGNPTSRDSMSARFERLQVHALNPGAAEGYLTMANYDRFGNLSLQLMREIRYAAQPVKKVLEIFKNAGITERKVLYETLLRGYWTPAGMIENATVVAKNYSGDGQSE